MSSIAAPMKEMEDRATLPPARPEQLSEYWLRKRLDTPVEVVIAGEAVGSRVRMKDFLGSSGAAVIIRRRNGSRVWYDFLNTDPPRKAK